MGLSSRTSGLSRGMRVFLLVDVVLVLALAVVALLVLSGVLGGGGAGDADPGARPAASPSSSASTPAPAATGVQSFASPTGNIACTVAPEGVTCTIASITFTPPGAESCAAGTLGHVVVASADGVELPCPDGPVPGTAAADVPRLEYGATSTVGDWTCTSATNGVTCADASGAGFRLARGELVELG